VIQDKRLFVVGDAEGRVIALAASHEPAEGEPYCGVVARPGQTIAEVSLPRDLAKLESLTELHKALRRFRLEGGKLKRLDDSAA
jgi:hypothetical protein